MKQELKKIFTLFKFYLDPTKSKILECIKKNPTATVEGLQAILGIKLNSLGGYLLKMRQIGLVFSVKKGKTRIYAINDQTIEKMTNLCAALCLGQDQIFSLLRALNNDTRQSIIDILFSCSIENPTVKDIYEGLKLVQSICTQHLQILHKVGLLSRKKIGVQVFYWVNVDFYSRVESRILEFDV